MRYREFAVSLYENVQQYRQMLQGMVNAGIIEKQHSDYVISNVRKLLKRNDRIVWWLKWYRIVTMYNFTSDELTKIPFNNFTSEEAEQAKEKVIKNFEKITKQSYEKVKKHHSDLETWNITWALDGANVNHISGMIEQIPQYAEFQWETDTSPSEMRNALASIEREWQESRRAWVTPESGDVIIDGLVYNNGEQAWVKLDRGACRSEGDAMGHCGNVPSVQPGDRILSFRTIRGEEHKPHLTFILDGRGYLGEMKGRANEKPQSKYHKYIVDLLKKPFVKGIKGGGYAPEENFELTDLPEQQMEALLDEKPALGGPVLMYKRNNRRYSQEIGEMLQPLVEDYLGYINFDTNSGEITIDTYSSMDDIGSEYGDSTLEYIGKVASGDTIIDTYVDDSMIDDKNIINDIYVDLDDETKTKLKRYIAKSPDVDDDNRDDPIDAIADLISNDDDIREAFQSGIYSGVEAGTESDMYSDAADHLTSNGFERVDQEKAKTLPDKRKSDEWILTTNATTVLDHMLHEDEDLEGFEWNDILEIGRMNEPRYGWSGWDSKVAAERTADELYNVLE